MASRTSGPPGTWARGGLPNLPSRPGGASAFASSSTAPPPAASSSAAGAFSAPSAFGDSRGGHKTGSSARPARGGNGGGNALTRAAALAEEDDPEAGEDLAFDSDGLAPQQDDDDDDGKAHARSQRFNKKFEGNAFERVSRQEVAVIRRSTTRADLEPPLRCSHRVTATCPPGARAQTRDRQRGDR